MADHEHDGSGCCDCECSATTWNSWPCTCPSGFAMKNRTTVDDVPVVQTILWHPRFENGRLGEMTVTQRGRFVTVEVELDKNQEELAPYLNFGLTVWPKPAVVAQTPMIPDNIVLGGQDA